MVKMEYENDLTVYANSETPIVIRYEGTEVGLKQIARIILLLTAILFRHNPENF